ncbi:tripeptidyl-peptidase B. Serine peptidase. MEROPS family S33 [Agrococcus baldri]|uniref:Tripeptidyl-peptidase B. Serine peptidase. MEROPS family S33 n=1 Tax=Agrococcus baldri TaxID=153730 RepID=A0AA94HL73_9MICO|nr:alpha/beta hydrolase [Agrococcus baldri]SFS06464.1 tripeptidyl-peptidase B. Serine peptidase. MEROPS family S33 [Agrococcus baldri]
MHRTRRGLAALAAIAVSTLALTGCILPPPLPGEPQIPGQSTGEPQWSPTGEQVAPELEQFYGQQVDWSDCGTLWCGTVTAPMNWDDPSADTIELAVTVAPATGERQGAILYNPGGPGASGIEYVRDYGDYLLHPDVREHYDLVGFDPRGVGASTPISCYDDPAELYDWLWEMPPGPAPEPLSDADLEQQLESAQWFADACLEHTGPYLEFVGTEQVASDMDLLRALFGQEKLNYLGVSYGTLIGSTYADLFADNVGRMVLDAAVAPDAADFEGTLHQAAGFELAYGNFVADCLGQRDCPFEGDKADALAQTRELIDQLDANPIAVNDGRQLGSGALFIAIAANLYSDFQWPTLRQILADVASGSGESAYAAADEYYGVNPDGTFADNSLESLIAVNCLDSPAVTDFDEIRANAEQIMAAAPTLGPDFVGVGSCAAWPFEATRQPHEITASGADPIIVIGGLNDPATSYQQAVDLAGMLESGVLISVGAEGHGQYNNGNACVDRPVNAYFLTGTAPTGDIDC